MENQTKKQKLLYQAEMKQEEFKNCYTDSEHYEMISELLVFPEDEDVSCLVPFIGDAEAAVQVIKKRSHPKAFIFGIEHDRETARQVQQNTLVEDCIYGDFLNDVMISENAFSFCFVNLPYEENSKEEFNTDFLKKIIACLMEEAVIVYIIPYYVVKELQFLTVWSEAFRTERIYKFYEQEFKECSPVVLIGRKTMYANECNELDKVLKDGNKLPLLPSNYEGEKIIVNPSSNKGVTTFQAKFFDIEKAEESLKNSILHSLAEEKLKVQKFITDRLSRPPIMPNAGQMYLMAISGAGQGRVGTKEAKDQHLQRGIITNVEESEYRQDEKGNMIEAVQRYTRVNFNIIENNGIIHKL